jgi:hypothetical protein
MHHSHDTTHIHHSPPDTHHHSPPDTTSHPH